MWSIANAVWAWATVLYPMKAIWRDLPSAVRRRRQSVTSPCSAKSARRRCSEMCFGRPLTQRRDVVGGGVGAVEVIVEGWISDPRVRGARKGATFYVFHAGDPTIIGTR